VTRTLWVLMVSIRLGGTHEISSRAREKAVNAGNERLCGRMLIIAAISEAPQNMGSVGFLLRDLFLSKRGTFGSSEQKQALRRNSSKRDFIGLFGKADPGEDAGRTTASCR
jgi:hypothetical protein